jgi:hypothetical protein
MEVTEGGEAVTWRAGTASVLGAPGERRVARQRVGVGGVRGESGQPKRTSGHGAGVAIRALDQVCAGPSRRDRCPYSIIIVMK